MNIARFYNFNAVVVSFFITYSCTAYADSYANKNSTECVLGAMKGVGSDVAARAIVSSCFASDGTENYDDCILDGMKGIGSDVAAMAIVGACANKFSKEFTQRKKRDADHLIVMKTKNDIRALESALDIYRLDNFVYPTTDQGLDALVNQPTSSPKPPLWEQGGYIKKLNVDPWGNAYLYLNPGEHGEIDIYSLGADGVPGGEDLNEDIGNWMTN